LRIVDCGSSIDGLPTGDCRLVSCEAHHQSALVNPSIGSPSIGNPLKSIRKSTIRNYMIRPGPAEQRRASIFRRRPFGTLGAFDRARVNLPENSDFPARVRAA
jgi:hypothetical protein